jgi:signal transduction histidine kinase
LHHLIENVLHYARLERNGSQARIEPVLVAELLDRVVERLQGRCQQAGMELCVNVPENVGQVTALADVSAVEQVLFNLVDNACKYAATSADRCIVLEASTGQRAVSIHVRDSGPGLDARVRRRLFRPFSKSAHEAANSAPGVGLGLALSRRLARGMGGDLRYDANQRVGASFALELPIKP